MKFTGVVTLSRRYVPEPAPVPVRVDPSLRPSFEARSRSMMHELAPESRIKSSGADPFTVTDRMSVVAPAMSTGTLAIGTGGVV